MENSNLPFLPSKEDVNDMRYLSRQLALPGLCRRERCLRVRECTHQNPEVCIEAFTPLVPDEVQDWAFAALQYRDSGLSIDQARDRYDEEYEALREWQKVLATTLDVLRADQFATRDWRAAKR